jgi:hypothetical protein
MTDLINEYYGRKGVRLLSLLAAGMILYGFGVIYLTMQLSPADWWIASSSNSGLDDMNLAFNRIFGQSNWIIVGSLTAFLVAQLIDVLVFHRIKRLTGEKSIWLRATGSTAVSQLIDSFVVLFIAFYIGQEWSISLVLAICTMNYLYKLAMAILLTPVIYLVHAIIERYLGKEQAAAMKARAMESK